ncbi:MAG: nucleotide exchange factor GrpE [Rhodopila sp.]
MAAMSDQYHRNEEPMNEQSAAEPHAASQDAPQGTQMSPEQMMQAASERITALEAELAEMKERWMRAEAENANVRARGRKDADDARQYAVQKFAADVVETAENLRRGIDSLPQGDNLPEIVIKVREGLEGVERSFLGTLERNGIKREDPVGQPFDPNLHQAMAEQASAEHAPGTVLQAWTPAWTLNGRLLKPAMVVVAAKRAEEDAAA